MQPRRLVSLLAVAALALAACGDDSDDSDGDVETTPEAEGDIVRTSPTALGDVLVDAEGMTLYGFTEDTDGEPTCYDDCAAAWPPLMVPADEVPDGPDPAVFSTVEREDGSFQLVAGDWPLYYFAGDSAPGDVNGQGVQGVWFVVDAEGELVLDADDPGNDTDDADDTDDDDRSGGY